MATTNFDTNHALTQKLWGKIAFKDAVKETLFGKLMGTSDRSVVQIKDELNKNAGDRARFRLRALPSGEGRTGDQTLEGHEEGLSYTYFDLFIDTMRHAHKTDLNMSQQRVTFDLRQECKDAQVEWWAERMDSYVIRYLSGDTTLSFAGNTGNAPSSNRLIYGGDATAKSNVDSSDKFTLSLIDRAVELAKLASPTMRKANFGGQNKWVCILHPYQVYDLRTNTNAGQWLDIQKAAMQGGKISDNPIFSGALGVYNDTILLESTRIMTFDDYGAGSVKAARALFLGAQAGVVAFGKGYGKERMKWVEKKFDYDSKFGVATTLIWGIQKTRFNGEDFAVIAIDTAAAPH